MGKPYFTARAFILYVLNSAVETKGIEYIKQVSKTDLAKQSFYQNEIAPLAHLCSKRVTYPNAERRIREFVQFK